MEIKKAVITAAGKGQRTLSLQNIVDRDGEKKTALTILLEEVIESGIEDIGIIIHPSDHESYRAAAGKYSTRIELIEQPQPLGYGHAVYCAKNFVKDEPFLLLVNDHIFISSAEKRCARQLIEVAATENCSVSGVQPTHESKLPYFGVVGGRRIPNSDCLYEIQTVLEKPTPTEAEQYLLVPGLRTGYYLCFFGIHVLTPTVMTLLAEEVARNNGKGGIQLSPVLSKLCTMERYLALEIKGRRFDLGAKYGLLQAQLGMALSGKDRDEILSMLIELLSSKIS